MQRRNSYFFLLFVIALGVLSALAFVKLPTYFGLDIKGGTRLNYRVVINADQKGKVSMEQARSQIIQVLLRRAGGMGAAEPVVAAKGEDQVIVEIPGIKDIKRAIDTIGSSARIEFYHARNVVSGQDMNRPNQTRNVPQ